MSRKGAELSTETKELIITLSESVKNKAELSRMLNIPRTTIMSVLSKYRRTGTVETLTQSGRKRSFTKNALRRLVNSNRRLTVQAPVVLKVDSAIRWINLYPVDSANCFPNTYLLDRDLSSGYSAIQRLSNWGKDIAAKLNECKTKTFSQKTVQRVLHSEGCKRRLAKKKIVVREANRKKRVKWSKERRGRTVDNYWEKVLFSDGSQIMLGTNSEGCPLLWDLCL